MSTDNRNEKVNEQEVPKYEAQEPKIPTKPELMAYLEEQLEVKSLQVKVQECNMLLQEMLLKEKEATYKLAQLQAQMMNDPATMIDHTITEEDLENNPDLVKEGIKVGDLVKIPRGEKI